MMVNDPDDDIATFALAQAVTFVGKDSTVTNPQTVVDAAELFAKFLRKNGRKRGDVNAV